MAVTSKYVCAQTRDKSVEHDGMCVENGAMRPENGTGWSMRVENGAGWCMSKITDTCKQSQNRRKKCGSRSYARSYKPCIYHVKMPGAPSSGFPSFTLL